MRLLRLSLIFLPIWLSLLALLFVLSEELACITREWRSGYFSGRDFSGEITITSDGDSKQIDVRKLERFSNICVVKMYTYGEPYGFQLTTGPFRYGGRRACWREEPGKLTIAGIDANGAPSWTQLTVDRSGDFYRTVGEECVEPERAVLKCVGDACSFSAPR